MQPEEVLVNRLFFSAQQRDDMRRLLSFVNAARQYVQNPALLNKLARLWQKYGDLPMRDLEIVESDDYDTRLVKRLSRLKIIYGLDIVWIDAFLVAALGDVKPQKFADLSASLHYVHGSAEVVGLMMAKLLRLPKEAQPLVKAEARAVQWMIFIRSLADDAERGFCYFPRSDLKKFSLSDLTPQTAQTNPENFTKFIQLQLKRYWQWQDEAKGLEKYLTRRQKAMLLAMNDANNRIALQLAKNPQKAYTANLYPRHNRMIYSALAHLFD